MQSPPVAPYAFEGDLRNLPKARLWQPGDPVREVNPRRVHARQPIRQPNAPPSSESAPQASPPTDKSSKAFGIPLVNVDGIPFTGVLPPDTVGDAGPSHYIQMVNGSGSALVTILDKAGATLVAPFPLSDLAAAATICQTSGFGDPVVLYDSLANRWLLSEFADNALGTSPTLCVYISKTADPVAGGWFAYQFATPQFPDYPKYAVWPSAYALTTNESQPAVYALDRTRMLAGLSATFIRRTVPPLAGFPFQALTPADLDGAAAPPVNAPIILMRHRDDEVHNVGSNNATRDFVEIWEFNPNFTTPASTTLTGPTNIAVAEFDSNLCGLTSFACFPQPGTATTLDPLREVILWRLQYRNFGSRQSLVGNFVTDIGNADRGGVRWFELRKIGAGAWTLFQQGTLSAGTENRWLGSIAMNGKGDIALGYSVTSASIFPSIRYTGRLSTDPLGQMPQGEHVLIAGTGAQNFLPANGGTRWGDYSALSVDPADDCTFWYTNEYIPTDHQWRTRIGKFRFDNCAPTGLIFQNSFE
ncbi:MAG: hypothetical protein U1F68_08150 [Gammaproteobacteria bacterium]